MNILINAPAPSCQGGVVSFFDVLSVYLLQEVNFHYIGSRGENSKNNNIIRRLIHDYIGFIKKIRSTNVSLVHLNPSLGAKAILRDGLFLLISKYFKKPTIIYWHGWDPSMERRLRRYFLPIFRRVYFKTDAFIVLADEFKIKLINMGYRGPIYKESTAVADEQFKVRKDIIHSSAIGNDKKYFRILFLSRMEKGKGIMETLGAYRILKKKHPHISLTMAGDGPHLLNVKEFVLQSNLSDVLFTGYLKGEKKANAYVTSDAYIFPSYHEGMPGSLLEAMAYGLPIVTRPVGGVKDIFEAGKMGFITDSLDPSVFADLLERLLLDRSLREKMGEFNQKYAFKHFRASIVAKRLIHIYEDVIEKHRPD